MPVLAFRLALVFGVVYGGRFTKQEVTGFWGVGWFAGIQHVWAYHTGVDRELGASYWGVLFSWMVLPVGWTCLFPA